MGKSDGRDFTIEHPLLTILIFSIPVVTFEFIASFLLFTAPSGSKWDTLTSEVIPLLWSVICLCVLVRSFLWKLLR